MPKSPRKPKPRGIARPRGVRRRQQLFPFALPTSWAMKISVPVMVRRSTVMPDVYPFEAEVMVAGYRHLAYGETKAKAVANVRDWVVNSREPENLSGEAKTA